MLDDDLTPRELLRRDHPQAYESLEALRDLARINPHLLIDVLELAMVLGVFSENERRRHADRDAFAALLPRSPSGWGRTTD